MASSGPRRSDRPTKGQHSRFAAALESVRILGQPPAGNSAGAAASTTPSTASAAAALNSASACQWAATARDVVSFSSRAATHIAPAAAAAVSKSAAAAAVSKSAAAAVSKSAAAAAVSISASAAAVSISASAAAVSISASAAAVSISASAAAVSISASAAAVSKSAAAAAVSISASAAAVSNSRSAAAVCTAAPANQWAAASGHIGSSTSRACAASASAHVASASAAALVAPASAAAHGACASAAAHGACASAADLISSCIPTQWPYHDAEEGNEIIDSVTRAEFEDTQRENREFRRRLMEYENERRNMQRAAANSPPNNGGEGSSNPANSPNIDPAEDAAPDGSGQAGAGGNATRNDGVAAATMLPPVPSVLRVEPNRNAIQNAVKLAHKRGVILDLQQLSSMQLTWAHRYAAALAGVPDMHNGFKGAAKRAVEIMYFETPDVDLEYWTPAPAKAAGPYSPLCPVLTKPQLPCATSFPFQQAHLLATCSATAISVGFKVWAKCLVLTSRSLSCAPTFPFQQAHLRAKNPNRCRG
ncbi:unnamed protein product [Closterium sp. NIES-65]|nr:unnamed protein product [Closterium sp. NIES-65]